MNVSVHPAGGEPCKTNQPIPAWVQRSGYAAIGGCVMEAKNTDKVLHENVDCKIIMTEQHRLGINVGGSVIVRDPLEWHRLASREGQIEHLTMMLKAAKHLILAATGPEGGPTDWNETRDRWMRLADKVSA